MNVNRVGGVVCFSLQSKYEVRTWVNVCVIQESVRSFVVLFAWGEGDYFSKIVLSLFIHLRILSTQPYRWLLPE